MRMALRRGSTKRLPAVLLPLLVAACSAAPTLTPDATTPSSAVPASLAPTASPGPSRTPIASTTPTPSSAPLGGIYSATTDGRLAAAVSDIPARVWVPNERGGQVIVIDPTTFEIVDRLDVGRYPEHVSPSWDGQLLYVNNMNANSMSVIDPRTGKVVGSLATPSPYNLYFTPDGTRAIVVEDMTHGAPEDENGLRFYTYPGFVELAFVPVRWAGADHLDFSADGRTIYLSCEYSGRVVVVDVATMKVTSEIVVGGFPTDVRLAPDGRYLFVANQLLHGLSVIDVTTGALVDFIKLQKGSHGLAMSRDATRLYVTNRLAGSLSVIDMTSRTVVSTWEIGGSPDMIAVSADGRQIWISNRWDRSVVVVDSETGAVLKSIETGAYPHGLAYWPLPGRFSLGHNGNMR
jgi:YVTN family beta-propeller protein